MVAAGGRHTRATDTSNTSGGAVGGRVQAAERRLGLGRADKARVVPQATVCGARGLPKALAAWCAGGIVAEQIDGIVRAVYIVCQPHAVAAQRHVGALCVAAISKLLFPDARLAGGRHTVALRQGGGSRACRARR